MGESDGLVESEPERDRVPKGGFQMVRHASLNPVQGGPVPCARRRFDVLSERQRDGIGLALSCRPAMEVLEKVEA